MHHSLEGFFKFGPAFVSAKGCFEPLGLLFVGQLRFRLRTEDGVLLRSRLRKIALQTL
jgi:hypothetical protein